MNPASVWGVVSAFCPDGGIIEAVRSIREQTDGVVVVDDHSGQRFSHIMDELSQMGAVVIRQDDNSGIAAALNRGIRYALAAEAEAVVTFDQDSHISANYVSTLVETRNAARARGIRVGPIVPEFFAEVRQVHGRHEGALTARHVIQSGMLIYREVLEDVGEMSEPLFIDLVDTEYELRCLDAGYVCIAAPGLRLHHSLGAQYRRPGKLPFPVMTLSTPFRYFYRARNRVMIDRQFRRSHPARILRDTALDRIHFALAWSLARPRGAFWRLSRAGVAAGRRGEGGRIPPDLSQLASTIAWKADRVR